jgi:AraC family transcriptional regulator
MAEGFADRSVNEGMSPDALSPCDRSGSPTRAVRLGTGALVVHRMESGLPSLDTFSFTAVPPLPDAVVVLEDGLAFARTPQLRFPEMVCEGAPCDRLIMPLAALPHLRCEPAPGLRARRLLCNSFVLLPSGTASRWSMSKEGFPAALHLHLPFAMTNEEEGTPSRLALGFRPQANLRDAVLERIMLLAGAQLMSNEPHRRLALEGYGLAAVARLATILQQDAGSAREVLGPARMRLVRAFVEENIQDPIRIADLASVAGLSTSYFTRAFRAEIGQTPYAWILGLRVERAKVLIRSSRLGLSEIAVSAGFASQSHMTETFRRRTGLPPGRWRDDEGR